MRGKEVIGLRVKRRILCLAALMLLAALSSVLVYAVNDIQCLFYNGASCPAGTVKFIGLQNDSGGLDNAHAQNRTLANYTYSLCCNNSNSTITMDVGCNGATFIRLSSDDNAHAETGNNSNYTIPICMNSTFQNVSCNYPGSGSCGAGFACILSMASTDSDNSTNAHISNCSGYSQKVCCGLGNNPPSAPALTYPVNNSTVYDRRLNFSWNASTDPEGDAITYTINATCGASCSCSAFSISGISQTNYTHSSDLCVDVAYNWTVTACDVYTACNTSAMFNFTVASQVIFDLFVNATSFGTMTISQSNQTDSGNPNYMVGRNDGNVLINGTLNASALFSSVAMDTTYYNYRAADNETGSIVAGCSQAAYTPMSTSQKGFFCNLSYSNATDEVRLHINITVPPNEAPGTKNSILEVTVVKAE